MAAEPEHSRGELIGKRVMQLVGLLWLGMLFAPVQELACTTGSMAVLGLAGVVAYLVVYVWAWFGRFAKPDANRDRLWRWAPLAALLSLSTILSLSFGPDWYVFFIFAGVGASVTLPTWTAVWCISGTSVLAALLGVVQRTSLQAIGLNVLTIGSVGAGTLMVSHVLRIARELRMTRAELARLAVANERLRFARDLHDLLGHSLSLIALKADLLEQLITRNPEQAVEEARDVQRVTRGALKEVREAVAGYRQPGLVSELASAREMLTAAGIGYHMDGDATGLPPIADATLAWVLREAVTNVIRHSRAHRCVMRLGVDAAAVRLEVVDDGSGAPAAAEHPAGSGLAGVAERVAAAGGSSQAGPRPGGGFQVVVCLPLSASPDEARA